MGSRDEDAAEPRLFAVDYSPAADGDGIFFSVNKDSMDLGIPERVKRIKSVWIRDLVPSDITLSVRLGSQFLESDPISWTAPQIFNAATDRNVDVIVEGNFISIEILNLDKKAFNFGGFDLEGYVQGRQ